MQEVAKLVKEVAKLVNQEPAKRTHPENERGHHISEVATDKKYPPRPETDSIHPDSERGHQFSEGD